MNAAAVLAAEASERGNPAFLGAAVVCALIGVVLWLVKRRRR